VTGESQGTILHATCVAVAGRGLLILGASGSGKSALALQLIALGARLVSDDRVLVTSDADGLLASCPAPAILGLIEARGFGLLRLDALVSARLILAVDLDQTEAQRLPPPRQLVVAARSLPLAYAPKGGHLPAALYLHLAGADRDLGA
jgi:HPr kinase/phosphorylase